MSTTTNDEEKTIKWKNTIRIRDRNRARFAIRERIVTESSKPQTAKNITASAIDDIDANICDQKTKHEKTLHYYKAIALGSASVFSLVSLSRDLAIISSATKTFRDYWSTYKIQTLCTSRFGKEYADAVMTFRDSIQSTTMLEYAALLGEYGVVGAILSGGILPLFTTTTAAAAASETDAPTEQCAGDGHAKDGEIQRKSHVYTIAMKKLLVELTPLSLAVYIVKSVIEMKMWGVVSQSNETQRSFLVGGIGMEKDEGRLRHNQPQQNQHAVTCCPICLTDIARSDTLLLRFSDCCNHWCCEICMWESLIENLDQRIHGDVVRCPICEKSRLGKALDEGELNVGNSQNTIPNCQVSLKKFQSLPISGMELKKLPKKAKSKNTIHSTWNDALLPVIGASQDVRKDKFIRYIHRGAIHHVRACLEAGVDVDTTNEYNQTPLHIACWRKHVHLISLLIEWGANVHVCAHGNISILNTLIANSNDGGCDKIIEMLKAQMINLHQNPTLSLRQRIKLTAETLSKQEMTNKSLPSSVTVLIPNESDHIGSGSCYIDNLLPESGLLAIEEIWCSIPIAPEDSEKAKKKRINNTPCSLRSYFCDSEGHFVDILSKNTLEAFHTDKIVSGMGVKKVIFFPHMRFLNYNRAGGELAPHIDLTRVDSILGKRSTHTFLLYLKNCEQGGETALLESLSSSDTVRNDVLMAKIKPRRNRLLLFPHECPHKGMEVVTVPKVLIRGEVFIEME